jgi:excisionase family DNA binding protein
MTLLTAEEVAARLRIAASAVYRLCREGQLGHLRAGAPCGSRRRCSSNSPQIPVSRPIMPAECGLPQ